MKTEAEIKKYREFVYTVGLAESEKGEFVLAILDWVME
jgi:hypothetical protein